MTGSGTQADPYIISDVDDLQDMNLDLSAYYELANDIDASATSGWNSGLGFEPVGDDTTPFTGQLDGKGYVISDLFINRTAIGTALFGQTDGATIRDVTITDCDITQTGVNVFYSAALIGLAEDTIVENCHSSGTVTGTGTGTCRYIGGLIGSTDKVLSEITDCSSSVIVTAGEKKVWGTGGLIGRMRDGAVRRCHATGSLTASGTDYAYSTGGLIGQAIASAGTVTVDQCYATGDIIGDREVGGLVGSFNHEGIISNCYARGDATGDDEVGGLIGEVMLLVSTIVDDCYSTGVVTGNTKTGGLIGDSDGTVTNCFWDTETSGQSSSDGGTGKTTVEMKSRTTFIDAGWNFRSIWGKRGCNDGYPCLQRVTPSCSGAHHHPTHPTEPRHGLGDRRMG